MGWLKALGVAYVLDVHSARSISLQETAHDFTERLRAAGHGHAADKPLGACGEIGERAALADHRACEASAQRGPTVEETARTNEDAGADAHMRGCSAELATDTATNGVVRGVKGEASDAQAPAQQMHGGAASPPPRSHAEYSGSDRRQAGPLPMLVSACPGAHRRSHAKAAATALFGQHTSQEICRPLLRE